MISKIASLNSLLRCFVANFQLRLPKIFQSQVKTKTFSLQESLDQTTTYENQSTLSVCKFIQSDLKNRKVSTFFTKIQNQNFATFTVELYVALYLHDSVEVNGNIGTTWIFSTPTKPWNSLSEVGNSNKRMKLLGESCEQQKFLWDSQFLTFNLFHNIWRLFDVLPRFTCNTIKTIGDYYL